MIVLVDDDGAIRDSLTFLLTVAGYPTCSYASSEDLLEACDLSRVAGLIVDYNLPGLSGLELAIEVRRLGWTFPMLLITAQRASPLRQRALEAGIHKVLEKPSSDNDVLEFAASLDIRPPNGSVSRPGVTGPSRATGKST